MKKYIFIYTDKEGKVGILSFCSQTLKTALADLHFSGIKLDLINQVLQQPDHQLITELEKSFGRKLF